MPAWPLLDVRTPAEFAQSHIPGAYNLPLFSNEERAEIGTLYKQVSAREAFLKGLELVGPKMRQLVEEAELLVPGRRVSLHCWRGGQRSSSFGWLLKQSGFEVRLLRGGYKAYRRHVLEELKGLQELPLLVVGGPTGAGKTEVLHELEQLGEQVLDLEKLAHHKGSSFGALGEEPQPSVAQFENDLHQRLQELSCDRRIWVENESRSIGRVYLPEGLWAEMERAPLFDLKVSLERRLERLERVYAGFSQQALSDAFQRIGKRLGGQRLKSALEALEKEHYKEAARIALAYYDKAYRHHTEKHRSSKTTIDLPLEGEAPVAIARALVHYANRNKLICHPTS